MHVCVGLKRYVVIENSFMLLHHKLGHISIERIKRLIKDGVFGTSDFVDLRFTWIALKVRKLTSPKRVIKGV